MRFHSWVLLLLAASGLSAAPFRVAVVGAPGANLDQRSWTLPGERPLLLAVTDGLVAFDPVTGLIKPGLASSWTSDSNGKSWSFTLKAAKWSDGTPLTAQDLAAAWKASGVKATVSAGDPKVFKAVFPQPVADVAVFSQPRYQIFPDAGNPGRGPGPFVIVADGDDKLVLEKNGQFRDAKSVKLPGLEFRFVPSFDEAAALFRDGAVDWVPRAGGPGTVVPGGLRHAVVSPGWGLVFLRLNLTSPRLGDADYRRSLSEALDRSAVAQGLRGAKLAPATTLVPGTTLPPLTPVKRTFGPRPEPVLTLLYPQGETYRSVAQEVADEWNHKLGIAVSLQAAPWSLVNEARLSGHYDVILGSWLGDWPDPSAFLTLMVSGSRDNGTGFVDPSYDGMVGPLRNLVPAKAREALVRQALARLAGSMPVVPLLSYASVNQINLRRWTGWFANPTDTHPWQGIGPQK